MTTLQLDCAELNLPAVFKRLLDIFTLNSYRQHNQPGCGGCLLLLALLALVTGGAQGLLNLFGFLIYSSLAGILVLIGGFWAFSYYLRR